MKKTFTERLEEILRNSYKKVRIPTGETTAGCKVVEEMFVFDSDQALIDIKSLMKEIVGEDKIINEL